MSTSYTGQVSFFYIHNSSQKLQSTTALENRIKRILSPLFSFIYLFISVGTRAIVSTHGWWLPIDVGGQNMNKKKTRQNKKGGKTRCWREERTIDYCVKSSPHFRVGHPLRCSSFSVVYLYILYSRHNSPKYLNVFFSHLVVCEIDSSFFGYRWLDLRPRNLFSEFDRQNFWFLKF
jgi:hypothetical protein